MTISFDLNSNFIRPTVSKHRNMASTFLSIVFYGRASFRSCTSINQELNWVQIIAILLNKKLLIEYKHINRKDTIIEEKFCVLKYSKILYFI